MAKGKQLVEDSVWQDRLHSSNLYYQAWEKLFKCKILEKYYEGIQWKSQKELGYNPYVFNKISSTIQFKLAEFLPTFPKFQITSVPSAEEWDLESAAASATLKESTLNTIIQNDNINFSEEMESAYKDSFFRFGIIEVGYAADWFINPNAAKPLLKKDTDRNIPNNDRYKIKQEPEELPVNERVFFKHIDAKRFRVGGLDHKYLNQCSWCGYYEYVNRDDLLSIKSLINRDKIENAAGTVSDTDTADEITADYQTDRHKGHALKVWRIWDLRSRMRLLILDDRATTIYQKGFKRLPLFDFRPDRRLVTDGFYPIPPVYNWLSSQDELNETREMLRVHRRRFIRKFQVLEGRIDDVELEKFETGQDGSLVKVKAENAIAPIDNADLGTSLNEAIQISGSDFNELAGISNQDLEVPDRSTATEANIINQKGSVRQLKDRDRITKWFSRIGREGLLLCQENFTSQFWIELNSPEGRDSLFQEMSVQQKTIKWITSEDLKDGYDFKIDVDLTTVSVAAQQEEKQKFLEFMAYMNQFPQLAFSPLLVRECAYRVGYRNEPAIREVQRLAMTAEIGKNLQMQAQINGLKQAATQAAAGPQPAPMGPPPGSAPQQIVQGQLPNNVEQVRNQLQNQVGTGIQ
jgi:hypothetical protein